VRRWLSGSNVWFAPPVMKAKRASVRGACATKLSGSSGRPSTLTRWPACTQRRICFQNVSGAAPNSPLVHSCVAALSCSCVHSVGSPAPNMKVDTLQTPLSHVRRDALE